MFSDIPEECTYIESVHHSEMCKCKKEIILSSNVLELNVLIIASREWSYMMHAMYIKTALC